MVYVFTDHLSYDLRFVLDHSAIWYTEVKIQTEDGQVLS